MAQQQALTGNSGEALPQKSLFIVAGCNGAGKSTLSRQMLPTGFENTPIFDGDIPFTQKVAELKVQKPGASIKGIKVEASGFVTDLFDNASKGAIEKGAPFAYEGHFTDRGQWLPLIDFKNAGYHAQMQYIGLSSVEASLQRVASRVRTGGHHVDPANVVHNYYLNAGNVDKNHLLFDRLLIYDGSTMADNLKPIAVLERGKVTAAVLPAEQPKWVAELMPQIGEKIAAFNLNRRENLVQSGTLVTTKGAPIEYRRGEKRGIGGRQEGKEAGTAIVQKGTKEKEPRPTKGRRI